MHRCARAQWEDGPGEARRVPRKGSRVVVVFGSQKSTQKVEEDDVKRAVKKLEVLGKHSSHASGSAKMMCPFWSSATTTLPSCSWRRRRVASQRAIRSRWRWQPERIKALAMLIREHGVGGRAIIPARVLVSCLQRSVILNKALFVSFFFRYK